MDDEKPALVTGKLRLSGLLTCASVSEAAIVHQYLPEHIRLSRAEPGCLSFEVTQSDDPMIWRGSRPSRWCNFPDGLRS